MTELESAERLAALGWDDSFAAAFASYADTFAAARVVAEHRDRYWLAGSSVYEVVAMRAGDRSRAKSLQRLLREHLRRKYQ